MTRFMLAVAALLFLGAAATAPASAAGGSDDGGGSGGKAGKIETVPVKPILVQIPGPNGLRRSIAITMSLEIASARERDQVVIGRPKLRARIFEAWASVPLTRDGGQHFDAEDIRRRAQQASDHLFGEGVVTSILITDIREILIP